MITRNTLAGFAVIAALLCAVGTAITASASTNDNTTTSQGTKAKAPELDGAKVYAWSCGSCHSERRPKERTDGEWEVITTHMRVRANLTAAQSAAVLNYLKENN